MLYGLMAFNTYSPFYRMISFLVQQKHQEEDFLSKGAFPELSEISLTVADLLIARPKEPLQMVAQSVFGKIVR